MFFFRSTWFHWFHWFSTTTAEKSVGRQASTKRLWSLILSHLQKHINLHRSLQISSLSHTAVIGQRLSSQHSNNNNIHKRHDSNAVNGSTDKANLHNNGALKPKVRILQLLLLYCSLLV